MVQAHLCIRYKIPILLCSTVICRAKFAVSGIYITKMLISSLATSMTKDVLSLSFTPRHSDYPIKICASSFVVKCAILKFWICRFRLIGCRIRIM